MKRLIFDLDNTLCSTDNSDYVNSKPNIEIINKMKHYQAIGFEIIIFTSRNQRTFSGNIGKINAFTLPTIVDWLKTNDVPYDEIYIGKPWCGQSGFYVDDRAIRPDEFLKLSYAEIAKLTGIVE
jgi:capsule biosynthesis phosphatase